MAYDFTPLHRPCNMMKDVDSMNRGPYHKIINDYERMSAVIQVEDRFNNPLSYDDDTFEQLMDKGTYSLKKMHTLERSASKDIVLSMNMLSSVASHVKRNIDKASDTVQADKCDLKKHKVKNSKVLSSRKTGNVGKSIIDGNCEIYIMEGREHAVYGRGDDSPGIKSILPCEPIIDVTSYSKSIIDGTSYSKSIIDGINSRLNQTEKIYDRRATAIKDLESTFCNAFTIDLKQVTELKWSHNSVLLCNYTEFPGKRYDSDIIASQIPGSVTKEMDAMNLNWIGFPCNQEFQHWYVSYGKE